MDSATCGVLCGHPGCWATRRRQEKGLTRSLPPLKFDDDTSDDEIQLPTQSICNILEDYGESPMDRYPLSTGGRPTHSVDGPTTVPRFSPHSFHSSLKLGAPHNTTASILSKQTRSTKRSVKRNPRLRLVEVQEVFDRDDLRAQWDETFVTKQYYVWMPNPEKHRRHQPRQYKDETGVSTAQTNPVLMKDLTECMIPSEIEQKREETILKRQPRTKSPGKTPRAPQASQDAILDGPIDREGINELLALPKETLMKVLEHTKKSDFTSPGRLHAIVQLVAQDDERARLALGARDSFKHKQLQDPNKKIGRHQVTGPGAQHYYDLSSTKPVYQLDTNADEDHGIIDRLSSVNTPIKKKRRRPVEDERGVLDERDRPESEADSVETFPRYARPLPGIAEPMGNPKPAVTTQRVLHYRGKIPSISLGLPELPSGLKTTKAFSYKRQDLDFSLGPVITPPSSYRSSEGMAYSEHGTTVKVNVPSTMPGMQDSQYRDDDLLAIHRVSPALSTNVPVPPAGTPATFAHGSPTKSAPAGPLQQQYSWDTTRITINWSQSALPPSPGMPRGDSAQVARLLSTPQKEGDGEGLEREVSFGEERALDTINETAREGAPAEAVGEATPAEPEQKSKAAMQTSEADAAGPPRPPALQLETSTLRRIGAGESPRQQSARSVESCPSPEQWPLISESSFENIVRPSVSEPALSARSERRRPLSRDNRKDLAARRAMDDSKMKTESPAPPPPSPEPKDHTGEARNRKDLRSRDSLTMAPLFEVAELDESSPRDNPTQQTKRHTSQSSRAVGGKPSKKIEITVPVETEDVSKDEDKESGVDKGGEMISQMTVMHVIPKGRAPGKKRTGELERVQETFLNVDIPAEDVSSLKAEHGSSHQEDISSNDTVVMSQTGTEVSEQVHASPRIKPPIPEEKTDLGPDGEEEAKQNQETIPQGEMGHNAGDVSARDKSLADVPNSQRDMLDISTESPELLCDSARFISHEQVSPVEGEDGPQSHRFVLGDLEGLSQENDENDDNGGKLIGTSGRKESLLGNLTRRLDTADEDDLKSKDEESAYGDGEGTVSGLGEDAKPFEEEKSMDPDTQPPGVFFFQGSSSSESTHEETIGQEEITANASQKVDQEDGAAKVSDVVNYQPIAEETVNTGTVTEKGTENEQDKEGELETAHPENSGNQDVLVEDPPATEESTKTEATEQNQEIPEADPACMDNLDVHKRENEDVHNTTVSTSNVEVDGDSDVKNEDVTVFEEQTGMDATGETEQAENPHVQNLVNEEKNVDKSINDVDNQDTTKTVIKQKEMDQPTTKDTTYATQEDEAEEANITALAESQDTERAEPENEEEKNETVVESREEPEGSSL